MVGPDLILARININVSKLTILSSVYIVNLTQFFILTLPFIASGLEITAIVIWISHFYNLCGCCLYLFIQAFMAGPTIKMS